MPDPYIISKLEFDGSARNYSELFPNSQVPIPTPGDTRKRNVNHTSKLPPAMDQGRLGSCVSCAVSAIKEYQEFEETGREEIVRLPNGTNLSQVVKKSAHYLHDQRLRDTNCVLRTPIEKTFTSESVSIGGADPVTTDVVEMCYELQTTLDDSVMTGVIPIGLGFKRDNCKHATFGRLNIGGENFNVVDDSEELFFSRVVSAGGLASSDDTNILALSEFDINIDEMDSRMSVGLRSPTSEYNFCHMYANRSNAILGEENKQYTTGQIVYFPDETNPRYRTEIEILQPTTFLSAGYKINSNKRRVFAYKITTGGKIKLLNRHIKFEYAKVKLARFKDETYMRHKIGSGINLFARGWNLNSALSTIGEVGIVDEIFWPYRDNLIWNRKVKTIPPELLELGKNQSLQLIGRYKDTEYHLHSLKLESVEEMIHAIEFGGPCVLATKVYNNYEYSSETSKKYIGRNYLSFWKEDPEYANNDPIPYPKTKSEHSGYHATTVVGFDYEFNSNGAIEGHFLIRNSWGTKAKTTAENFVNKCSNCDKEYAEAVAECDDCGSTTLVEPIFGDLPGHQIMSFDDWSHIYSALYCKDNVNQLPYAPSDPVIAKEFYYDMLKNYCIENFVSIPNDIPNDQVFLLAIRGWRHDRPSPKFRERYSDTIVVISSEFEITTFLASTQSFSKSPPTKRGWLRLANGVYHYNLNKKTYPEYLVPTTPVVIEFSDNIELNTEYRPKEETNTSINICAGNTQTSPPAFEIGTEHPIGSHVIPLDTSTDPVQYISDLIGLLVTNHTKTENFALADALKLSIFSEEEKKGFIDDNVQSVDVPADIIYALIDSDEVIQYVENSQNGGGN